jgi:hypothetical protein
MDSTAGPWPAAEAAAFARLALRCVEFQRHRRPSLQAVVLVPELQRLCARAQQRARDAAATAAAVAEQAAARQHHPSEPPAHLLCPITQQLMEHPVVAADGHTYERAALEAWLRSERARGRSPLTNMPLEHARLVTNYAINAGGVGAAAAAAAAAAGRSWLGNSQ